MTYIIHIKSKTIFLASAWESNNNYFLYGGLFQEWVNMQVESFSEQYCFSHGGKRNARFTLSFSTLYRKEISVHKY